MRGVRSGLALLLMVLCAACSRGVEAPEGFTAVSDGPAGFAYPEGWEVAQSGGSNIVALGETGPGELRQHAILQIDASFSGDFDTGVDGLNTLANAEFANRQLVGDEPIEVPGAQQARLLTSTYLLPGEDAAATPVDSRQYALFALGGDETLYLLEVGSPVELFDEQAFRRIIDSFTLDG